MIDDELRSIKQVLKALEPHDDPTRSRIIRYVCDVERDRDTATRFPPLGPALFDTNPPMQCREPDLSDG